MKEKLKLFKDFLKVIPQPWRSVLLLLILSAITIYLLFSCGISKVNINNTNSDSNTIELDINSNPSTSTTLDSLNFQL